MKSASRGPAGLILAVELALLLTAATFFFILRSSHPGPVGLLLAVASLAVFPALMFLVPPVIGRPHHRSATKPSASHTLNLLTQPSRRQARSSEPSSLLPQPKKHTSLREKLEAIDWFQFEKVIALAIQKSGHKVTRRGGARPDNGIDLLVHADGRIKAVQCKHWRSWRVGVKDIREFLGALTAERISEGAFVTLGTCTPQARAFAEQQGIHLLDGDGLLEMLNSVNANFDPEFLRLLAQALRPRVNARQAAVLPPISSPQECPFHEPQP